MHEVSPVPRAQHYIRCEPAFTILELLVFMAITAIALAMVMPLATSGRAAADLHFAASSTFVFLRNAHSEAITQNREQVLTIDLPQRRIWNRYTRRSLEFGPKLTMLFTTPNGEASDSAHAAITFHPDGSSTGGRVVLSNGFSRILLDIDWLTGVVRQSEVGGSDGWSR